MAVDVLFATGYRFKDKTYAAVKNAVEETRAQWEIAQAQFDRHKRCLALGLARYPQQQSKHHDRQQREKHIIQNLLRQVRFPLLPLL